MLGPIVTGFLFQAEFGLSAVAALMSLGSLIAACAIFLLRSEILATENTRSRLTGRSVSPGTGFAECYELILKPINFLANKSVQALRIATIAAMVMLTVNGEFAFTLRHQSH